MPNTKADPTIDARHKRRADLFQQLFAWTFHDTQLHAADTQANEAIKAILAELPVIDKAIVAVAPERPLEEINKVDLAVLRVILWEARTQKTPRKVLVDEGIELAKAYGADQSAKFVNATLARLLLDETPPFQI